MKKFLSLILLLLSILSFSLLPAAAFAAKPVAVSPKPAPELVGYDVSYPQCGKRLPTDHYFGIVGVNGGNAASTNSCLTSQLVWAKSAKTGSKQSKVQLYVNTANPAQDSAYTWSNWPTASTANNPYGACSGQRTNDAACSWQYGWNRSIDTEAYFVAKAKEAGLASYNSGDYWWWLDVETMNSWQTGSAEALARNAAALEGFAAYYQSKGAKVGLYSTEYQWGVIAGNTYRTGSNLLGLANWRPSGASLANAKENCSKPPLTPGGYISLTQYVVKNLDNNHSCI